MSIYSRISILLLLFVSFPTFAATRTWTGAGGNALWSNPANWDGGVAAPGASDDLVFPAGALQTVNNNDFAVGFNFNSISITGAGYNMSGNQIGIASAINSSQTATLAMPFYLASNPTFSVTGGTLTMSGALSLFSQTVTLYAQGGSGVYSGVISGPAGGLPDSIIKTGTGDWSLTGANTFMKRVSVNAGYLLGQNASALGVADNTAANGLMVNPGGTFSFGVSIGAEHITVDGSGQSGNGVLQSPGVATHGGTLVLVSNSVAMNILLGSSLQFNGVVTGAGRLGMGNPGTYILGNAGNDFAGGVQWGATGGADSVLRLAVNNGVPTGLALNVPAGGTFDLNGFNQTVLRLTGAGSVNLGAGATLTETAATGTFSGVISGTGNVVVQGGSTTLTGVNTWTGSLTNTGATVIVNTGSVAANYTQSAGILGLSTGGTISGSVAVNGGTFAPGSGGTGTGNTGSLTLAPATTYSETINGTALGSYGFTSVTGAVNLGGTSLAATVNGGPYAVGTMWIVVANDGIDPVVGTFAGIAQGGTFAAAGQNFSVSYSGGDGNDVVFTAQGLVVTPTTTTVTGAPNPSIVGQNVTFTATVTGAGATGNVTFYDGITPLGTVALAGGTAMLSTNALTLGTHTITAQYAGDASFSPSTSGPFLQTVNAAFIPTLDARMLALLIAALVGIAFFTLRR